jgi:hypothetical protein
MGDQPIRNWRCVQCSQPLKNPRRIVIEIHTQDMNLTFSSLKKYGVLKQDLKFARVESLHRFIGYTTFIITENL